MANGGKLTWDEVRPTSYHSGGDGSPGRLVRLGIVGVLALVLWTIGLRAPAVVLAVSMVALTVASVKWPTVDRWMMGAATRMSTIAGTLLSWVLMGLVHVLVLLPASLWLRLSGRDPLARRDATDAVSFWIRRRPVPPALSRRQYTVEQARSVGRPSVAMRFALATGVVSLVVAANFGIGVAIDAAVSGDGERRDDATTAAFEGREWAASWFADLTKVRQRWDPFLGFVADDYQSDHLNIEGFIRLSYQAETSDDPDAHEIWFFGGSTMWGTGQRDGHTIPSAIARLAERDEIPIEVRNYGQRGWTIWQEVGLLTQLLAAGETPDVVVFYDGVNEVNSQYLSPGGRPTYGRAPNVEAAVRSLTSPSGLLSSLWQEYKERSALHQLARALGRESRAPIPSAEQLAQRADDAVVVHQEAVGLAVKIAAAYEFDVFFFWQPAVYTKSLGEEDALSRLDERFQAIGEMYLRATPQVSAPVRDISSIFGDLTEPVFFDSAHTNELGAAIVAKGIYEHLEPQLQVGR